MSWIVTLAYMDNFTLGGSENEVSADMELIIEKDAEIVLDLNFLKCEVISA